MRSNYCILVARRKNSDLAPRTAELSIALYFFVGVHFLFFHVTLFHFMGQREPAELTRTKFKSFQRLAARAGPRSITGQLRVRAAAAQASQSGFPSSDSAVRLWGQVPTRSVSGGRPGARAMAGAAEGMIPNLENTMGRVPFGTRPSRGPRAYRRAR